MFNEGDRVVFDERGSTGTVLEICNDTVYVEADNGVEMEMSMSQLRTKEAYDLEAVEKRKTLIARTTPKSSANRDDLNNLKSALWNQSVEDREKRRFIAFLETNPKGRVLLKMTDNQTTEEKFNYLVNFLNVPGVVLVGTTNDSYMLDAVLATALLKSKDALGAVLLAKCQQTIENFERNN